MNTIHQQVLNQYLAIVRSDNKWSDPAGPVKLQDTGRQDLNAKPESPKLKTKGRYLDVVA